MKKVMADKAKAAKSGQGPERSPTEFQEQRLTNSQFKNKEQEKMLEKLANEKEN